MASRRHWTRLVMSVTVILASLLAGGAVLANHVAGETDGTLGVGRPWGPADQDGNLLRVELTYVIKAKNIAESTVQAVEDAIKAWNTRTQVRPKDD